MGKKISNFSIIFYTICLIIISILGYSYYKITTIRNERMIFSMEENIKYFAKKCVLEEKCKKEFVLKDLYDNNYMEEVINPVSKEILDDNTKLTYKDDIIKIEYIEKEE